MYREQHNSRKVSFLKDHKVQPWASCSPKALAGLIRHLPVGDLKKKKVVRKQSRILRHFLGEFYFRLDNHTSGGV